jgi:hypothetical protein
MVYLNMSQLVKSLDDEFIVHVQFRFQQWFDESFELFHLMDAIN